LLSEEGGTQGEKSYRDWKTTVLKTKFGGGKRPFHCAPRSEVNGEEKYTECGPNLSPRTLMTARHNREEKKSFRISEAKEKGEKDNPRAKERREMWGYISCSHQRGGGSSSLENRNKKRKGRGERKKAR